MKKFGKKLLLVLTVSTLMCTTLVGCAEKRECDGCQEEKMCNEYEISMLGESEDMWLCKDCAEEVEDEGSDYGIDIEKK